MAGGTWPPSFCSADFPDPARLRLPPSWRATDPRFGSARMTGWSSSSPRPMGTGMPSGKRSSRSSGRSPRRSPGLALMWCSTGDIGHGRNETTTGPGFVGRTSTADLSIHVRQPGGGALDCAWMIEPPNGLPRPSPAAARPAPITVRRVSESRRRTIIDPFRSPGIRALAFRPGSGEAAQPLARS
jgi:hypothetical protein